MTIAERLNIGITDPSDVYYLRISYCDEPFRTAWRIPAADAFWTAIPEVRGLCRSPRAQSGKLADGEVMPETEVRANGELADQINESG